MHDFKAADRGARVRLLLDDIDLSDRDESLAVFASHPNIDLRIFNPFSRNTMRDSQFLTRFSSVTRRMHNKSFTVDNQVTVVGGRNIGDEYISGGPAQGTEHLSPLFCTREAGNKSFACTQ